MNDELRKLDEAAIDEAAAYRRGEGRNPRAPASMAFQNEAGPAAVLALLDKIEALEDTNQALADNVTEWAGKAGALEAEIYRLKVWGEQAALSAAQEIMDQRDEAQAAVKRLAGALIPVIALAENWLDSHLMKPDEDPDIIRAREVLADPIVKRIVEGG